MKNKIIVLFCFSALIISIYFTVPVSAAPINNFPIVFISNAYGLGEYYICAVNVNTATLSRQSSISYYLDVGTGSRYFLQVSGRYAWSNLNDAINAYNTGNYSSFQSASSTFGMPFVVLKGSINFSGSNKPDNFYGNYDDYIDAITPPWYVQLWDDFKDFVSDLGLALLSPFDPNSILDIADWFENAWTVKVGEGEDDLLNQIEVITPTPTPVPPTPIPYQTVIVPDGNGGSIIQYKYLNPSGTPIITDQPPQQNVTINYDNDNDFEYPYYENPENKDNPFKFKIPWYLKLVLRHNDIDIDTLDDHYQVAQNQVQSEDVVNAVNEVYNGFQVLPTDWLLLLGAIASIPLFAALIHRFLQG